MTMDINCDLGEGFGRYNVCDEKEIMPLISSCNVACGFHAGDPLTILQTVKMAIENELAIGAHPGYPDLVGFGRRDFNISPEELGASILYQISAVKGICESLGTKLGHVKLHGALYNKTANDEKLSGIVCEQITKIDDSLVFTGMPDSAHETTAAKYNLRFRKEAFADRLYDNGGRLVSRSIEGSVLVDPEAIFSQMETISIKEEVVTIEGNVIGCKADTICVHGDNPAIVQALRMLRQKYPPK